MPASGKKKGKGQKIKKRFAVPEKIPTFAFPPETEGEETERCPADFSAGRDSRSSERRRWSSLRK